MEKYSHPENSAVLLNRKALRTVIPASDVSIWRWIKQGKFPQPLSICNRNYWRSDEIDQWLEEQTALRDDSCVSG